MSSKTTNASCRIQGAAWTLTFTAEVLQMLSRQGQTGWASKESVGQLYSRDLTQADIVVGLATVLPKTRAHYSGVQFSPEMAANERARLFKAGWHCIGLWHSHPEPYPEPSAEDGMLAMNHAQAAATHLYGLVFAILGNRPLPDGLGVWLHDGTKFLRADWCHPVAAAAPQESKQISKKAKTKWLQLLLHLRHR